jgi:hypothetical protein
MRRTLLLMLLSFAAFAADIKVGPFVKPGPKQDMTPVEPDPPVVCFQVLYKERYSHAAYRMNEVIVITTRKGCESLHIPLELFDWCVENQTPGEAFQIIIVKPIEL